MSQECTKEAGETNQGGGDLSLERGSKAARTRDGEKTLIRKSLRASFD